MNQPLSEEEQGRDEHRTLILGLAGFSFTGVAGLAVVDSGRAHDAMLLLLFSFLAFLWALNIQGYKVRRWHDTAGASLIELGTLAMVLALCNLVSATSLTSGVKRAAYLFAAVVWALDFAFKIYFDWTYLTQLQQASRSRGEKKTFQTAETTKRRP